MFDFSAKVGALPDGRQSPRHHGKKIFDSVFLGAACQFPALHRIETECQRGALSKRIGPLSEDAIGYALERQDPGAIFALGCEIARQLKRNGIFGSDWSRGPGRAVFATPHTPVPTRVVSLDSLSVSNMFLESVNAGAQFLLHFRGFVL